MQGLTCGCDTGCCLLAGSVEAQVGMSGCEPAALVHEYVDSVTFFEDSCAVFVQLPATAVATAVAMAAGAGCLCKEGYPAGRKLRGSLYADWLHEYMEALTPSVCLLAAAAACLCMVSECRWVCGLAAWQLPTMLSCQGVAVLSGVANNSMLAAHFATLQADWQLQVSASSCRVCRPLAHRPLFGHPLLLLCWCIAQNCLYNKDAEAFDVKAAGCSH